MKQEDNVTKITDNEEYLSQLLQQQLELTGEVEKAIDLLVAEEGIPKRIAESLACGLHLSCELHVLFEQSG